MVSDENAYSGYRTIDEIPAQHIRLFSPWIFDESMKLMEVYGNVLNSTDRNLLQNVLSEQNEDRRITKLFDASVKILSEDAKARIVLQRFFESSEEASAMKKFIMFNDSKPGAFQMYSDRILNHPRCSNLVDKIAAVIVLLLKV
uniref:Uncharacterized protein n=1 Tax=Panagrolaimus davidi TaxID=227884 RepID=A0A914PKP8_9BILA